MRRTKSAKEIFIDSCLFLNNLTYYLYNMIHPTILIIEDELVTVELLKNYLQRSGYETLDAVSNSTDALQAIINMRPDLILMDITIKGEIDGIELTKIINTQFDIPVIYLTGFADRETVARAKITESYGYIIKPFNEIDIVSNIEIGLEKYKFNQKLKLSEERYRVLFDSITDAVFIHDEKGVFVEVNQHAGAHLGYSREELLKMSLADISVPGEKTLPSASILELRDKGSIIYESKHLTREGALIPVEIHSSLINFKGMPVIISIVRDITERYQYIEKLNAANDENKYLLNSIASILIGLSIDDTITRWNRVAEETFGLQAAEVLGKKITGFNLNMEWQEIYLGITACISNTHPVALSDIKYTDKEGNEGLLGITITPIKNDDDRITGILLYGRDITDKRIMEQQLLQTSKMATIGEIATGIAHELNQPLNIIKIASQYVLDSIKEKYYTEDFLNERIAKIIKQVDRAANIITHLREFGRKSDYNFQKISPNQPVSVAFELLGEQLQMHSIEVMLDLDKDIPLILGDTQKLEQVFINMIINSKDAFEEMKMPLQERKVHVRSYFKKKEKTVFIEYGDNGPGIPKSIIDKIFQPFFTTKEVGKGTGLGLSISYGIIKSHQGTLDAVSNESGAAFVIRLPIAKN
jgi:histidine kinase